MFSITSPLSSRTESLLQAAEIQVLRLILGVTRRDRMKNTQIRQDLNVMPLLEDIEGNRLRLHCLVVKLNDEKRNKRKIAWVSPAVIRPFWWPRKTNWCSIWEEGYVHQRGWENKDILEQKGLKNPAKRFASWQMKVYQEDWWMKQVRWQ